MSKVSGLSSIPWHTTTLSREDGDERRHKANCIHYEDNLCKCFKSSYVNKRCGGSAHCSYYKVKPKEMQRVKDESEPYWY